MPKLYITLTYLFIFQQTFNIIFGLSGTFTELKQGGSRTPGCLLSSSLTILNKSNFLLFGGQTTNIGAESGPFTYNFEKQIWQLVFPSRLASPRYEHSAIIKDDNLVIFGGRYDLTDQHKVFNDIWIYSQDPPTWNKQNDNGPKMHGHSAFYDQKSNSMLVFGGCYGDEQFFNDLWSYNFDTKSWAIIEVSGPKPPARCVHSAVNTDDSRMIIFGGYGKNDKYYNDMWILHYNEPNLYTWESVNYLSERVPTPRYSHSSVLTRGNNILVFGGSEKQRTSNDFWTFDLNESKWSEVLIEGNKKPSPRSGHAVGLTENGDMFLFGGYQNTDVQFLCDLWLFTQI